MRLGVAILRAAALLAPRAERAEWFAEWYGELWHVSRVCGYGTRFCARFCLGSFADALWLRRNSLPGELNLATPARCLGFLAFVAAALWVIAALAPGIRNVVLPSPYVNARNLAIISPETNSPLAQPQEITLGEFNRWKSHKESPFDALAFYSIGRRRVTEAGGRSRDLRVATVSANLFEMLGLSRVANSAALPVFIERGHTHLSGGSVEIGGERARVAGVLKDDEWRLPGDADAWLVEDDRAFALIPQVTKGFVLARLKGRYVLPEFGAWWSFAAPGEDWDVRGFGCEALSPELDRSCRMFLMMLGFGCALGWGTSSLSLGEYTRRNSRAPLRVRLRRWGFLAAKIALLLPCLYCGTLDLIAVGALTHSMAPVFLIYAIYPPALRWVAADQRRRCPVCLRVLTNPVRVGEGRGLLLGYSAIEFMCSRGHGLMHIPEFPTSWFAGQRWVELDGSWRGLFAGKT